MKRAIEEYRRRREGNLREIEKLEKEYQKSLRRKKNDILKRLDKLEGKKLPKGIDEKLAKKVEADRTRYVASLRRTLKGIETMEDLGKKLPELAKLHVDHGRYLLIAFEKDIYGINRLLKELSEEYAEYSARVSELQLPELNVEGLFSEIEETKRLLEKNRAELKRLEGELQAKEEELQARINELGIEELERRLGELKASRRKVEMEVRSKVSKVQKPIKRMRLGGIADEVARDSGVALERPKEFLSLLIKVYPRLEGKAKKSADWLIKNLESKVAELNELGERIEELEAERNARIEELEPLEQEIRTLERTIAEMEENLKRIERKLDHLQREFEEELKALEELVGEKVEVSF